jgi:two-component system copper resistance phosphate regulon response regulator CusR
VRILVLEDDPATSEAVEFGLESSGYSVTSVPDAVAAKAAVQRYAYDAAVLDVAVPGGSGYEVLEVLRAQQPGAAVLMLTARDTLEDRVEGLDRGADDYLVKPFAFTELLARLRAILRRPAARVDTLRWGELEVDLLHRRASVRDTALNLTPKELELLHCLLARRGEVVSRREILEQVWGYRFDPGTNVVDVHVARLRSKLQDVGLGDLIGTRRRLGYAVD